MMLGDRHTFSKVLGESEERLHLSALPCPSSGLENSGGENLSSPTYKGPPIQLRHVSEQKPSICAEKRP